MIRRFSSREVLWGVLVGQIVLGATVVFLFFYVGKVQADSLRGDTEITADDLLVIEANCQNIQSVRLVLRDLLAELIRINREMDTPQARERIALYQGFLVNRLGDDPECKRLEGDD